MKRKILSKISSLVIICFTIMYLSTVSHAASESIYFWDRYEVKTYYEINRHPTFTIDHAGWGQIEWYISIDETTGDIWFTKGSKQIQTYFYPAGAYIKAYDIVEDSNFIKAMGRSFETGDSFNYSEAIRSKKNIRMSYWSGPVYLHYQNDEWLHFCKHEMYDRYNSQAFVTANARYTKENYKDTVSSYSRNMYPDNDVKDGYWYVYSHSVTNNFPTIELVYPIANLRSGNQDNIEISGNVRDLDTGQIITIKYSIENITNQNITLIQPTKIISNSQWQMFGGYIQLQGLKAGTSLLELWAEDNQGGKSKTVEIPIIIFSTLENILDALKKYTVKTGNPQFMIINSDSRIVQNIENDRLIEQIKKELQSKNIKLFFSGKDGETEAYISSKLLN